MFPARVETAPAVGSPLPLSLPGCLQLIWSAVLFPGTAPEPCRIRWRSLLLLLLIPGLFLYPGLNFHLFEPDEARYAQIPREMLQRGEWVVPLLQNEPYLDKPPLLYWLVMLSYRTFGVHEWAARLVPALAAHGCVLAAYLLGRRGLGEGAAFWGALLLGLAPGFTIMGRLLLLDGLLTFLVTLALLSSLEAVRGERLRWGWWLAAAAACGLGVLTKGPVVLILLLPPLWLFRKLSGCPWAIPWSARLAFLGVLGLVALPWYVAVCLRRPDFARHFLWEHNVLRFLSPFDHLQPVWYYFPILFPGMLPGTLLLLPFLYFLFSPRAEDAQRRPPEVGFLLLAAGWCFLFFSLSGSKLPTYVLPAFPPLALALGCYLGGSGWLRTRWPFLLGGLSVLILALAHNVGLPWYAWYRSPIREPDVVARFVADPHTPVLCYPRLCHTVMFEMGRTDLRTFRSRDIDDLRAALRERPRTVVLLTHRHSLEGLQQLLPPELHVVHAAHLALPPVPGLSQKWTDWVSRRAGETALGLCDIAVVERRPKKK